MRLAVIVGHDSMKQGARMISPLSISEYKYNFTLALEIAERAPNFGVEAKIFLRNEGIERAYKKVNDWMRKWDACAVELHFNACDDKTVTGTETLIDEKPYEQNMFLATKMHESVCEVFNRSGASRGVKLLKPEDRGHYNMSLCEGPSCLIEPFFGTNLSDASIAIERKIRYAEALCQSTKIFLRELR